MNGYTVVVYFGILSLVKDDEIKRIGWSEYFARQRQIAESYSKGKTSARLNIKEDKNEQ